MRAWFFLLLVIPAFTAAQTQTISISPLAGITLGGTIPEKKIDGSSGQIGFGLTAGVSIHLPLSQKTGIYTGIHYENKRVSYQQNYRKDTLVSIEISGNTEEVPSYYYADVDGEINLHYLCFPVHFYYKPSSKSTISIGPYFNLLIAGIDTGFVDIEVGEGGFFEPYHSHFNNINDMKLLEWGASLSTHYNFNKTWGISLYASRSFVSVYQKGFFKNNGFEENKLFSTYVSISLHYNFFLKAKE